MFTKWQIEIIEEYELLEQRLDNYRKIVHKIWIPKYRWQLISWLSKRYPSDCKKFKRMNMDRLYAIYFRIRED